MDSYGDGNVYRGQVCRDSEIKTIEINRYNADVERLVEAARESHALSLGILNGNEDMSKIQNIERKLKAALEPFKK